MKKSLDKNSNYAFFYKEKKMREECNGGKLSGLSHRKICDRLSSRGLRDNSPAFKVQRRVFRAQQVRFRIHEIRRKDRECRRAQLYIKSINEHIRIPRIYLHFGARDATRPSILCLTPCCGLYIPRMFIEASASSSSWILTSTMLPNVKPAQDAKRIYAPQCCDHVDY